MDEKVSKQTKTELIGVLRYRYNKSPKKLKTQILNEFINVSGYHRKHAIRLLKEIENNQINSNTNKMQSIRRIYNEAVKEALIVVWEASDRLCSKRLKAILPDFVESMERHGHLKLDHEVRRNLLKMSVSTIDRLLSPIRNQSQSRRKKRKSTRVSKEVPIRTFADWDGPNPGYLEIDFVVHCGGLMYGSFIYTLVVTDVCSGWTDFIPLLAREQSLVVEGLERLFKQIPFQIKGIDSDNDGAFINDTLLAFCREYDIEFTRSRAYRKNDQAWIEQKNGAVIRKMVGHERFSGIIAGQALANLYQSARRYVNYFQPSFKLRKKVRDGSKVKRTYYPPATPCDRLLKHPEISDQIKEKLRRQRTQLDPVELLHHIRKSQSALAALASKDNSLEGPRSESLDQFLSQLPKLWKSGEVRPTHRKHEKPRYWSTRKDPFEMVWGDILCWLQKEPDIAAKTLFKRLKVEHSGKFYDGQLRTLQRRIKEWRSIMAKKLVYACMNEGQDEAEFDSTTVEIIPHGG